MSDLLAILMLVFLLFYSLLGGADFGGGALELLAKGNNQVAQRQLIKEAIGPIWEANHVWLIAFLVTLFTCFPTAFSEISVALHIPLTLSLLGIVFRGAAFTFRAFYTGDSPSFRQWARVFSVASIATPIFFGITLGTITAGYLPMASTDSYLATYVSPWLSFFPFVVGLLTLSVFAYLAAVYLCVEAVPDLQDEFRMHAFKASAWIVVLLLCALAFLPPFLKSRATIAKLAPILSLVGLTLILAVVALYRRRFVFARLMSALFVIALVSSLVALQYPYLVPPQLTVESAAAPDKTLRAVLIIAGAGSIILFPSLYYLILTFKGRGALSLFR